MPKQVEPFGRDALDELHANEHQFSVPIIGRNRAFQGVSRAILADAYMLR